MSRRVLALAFVACLATLVTASPAGADDRSDLLIRMLRTSDAFRVRAQAALSLGALGPASDVTAALADALHDENDAVRAAAAASLEHAGDASAIEPLREATRDRVAEVRAAADRSLRALSRSAASPPGAASTSASASRRDVVPDTPARYYVGVGTPGTRVSGLSPDALAAARAFVSEQVSAVSGVVLAPDGERARDAQRVLRSRGLVGVYLDSSVVSVDARADGSVRAQVSIVVQSYPDRNVRSMLTGAATVSGAAPDAARSAAIRGALEGALRNLEAALASSAGHG